LALMAAVADGTSRLERFPPGRDCGRTVELVQALGVRVRTEGNVLEIEGHGFEGLRQSESDLDAGNSGTTARIACGVLAGLPFDSRIVGDESLSRRPFDRVVQPLTLMGASIEATSGHLPLVVHGGRELRGIDYELPVPSAQVKTAILLAGLRASGTTRVRERVPSRNHTELALADFGAAPLVENGDICVSGGIRLQGHRFLIPGDFSSAAFFIGAASFLPGSELVVTNVGLNPTRAALLEVLKRMGADIETEVSADRPSREPVGNITVRASRLHGVEVDPQIVPCLIDELPILAVVAAFAEGTTRIEGASELRVKESDRLAALLEGLSAIGARVEPLEDGLVIHGGAPLRPAALRGHGDHRMVMAWAIASLGIEGGCKIDEIDPVKISFPSFFEALDRLVH
jgi:3-phosphoshikimate 1-carboxyvinyltransferase